MPASTVQRFMVHAGERRGHRRRRPASGATACSSWRRRRRACVQAGPEGGLEEKRRQQEKLAGGLRRRQAPVQGFPPSCVGKLPSEQQHGRQADSDAAAGGDPTTKFIHHSRRCVWAGWRRLLLHYAGDVWCVAGCCRNRWRSCLLRALRLAACDFDSLPI